MGNRVRPAVLAAMALAGCGGGEMLTVRLADGVYNVVSFSGTVPAGEQADLRALTARLDRAAGTLVLTLADGSQRTLAFASRPRAGWRSDCFTMSSHVDNEVADLSPGPLQIGSLVLASPVVYPKCSADRMILSEEANEVPPVIAFDRSG